MRPLCTVVIDVGRGLRLVVRLIRRVIRVSAALPYGMPVCHRIGVVETREQPSEIRRIAGTSDGLIISAVGGPMTSSEFVREHAAWAISEGFSHREWWVVELRDYIVGGFTLEERSSWIRRVDPHGVVPAAPCPGRDGRFPAPGTRYWVQWGDIRRAAIFERAFDVHEEAERQYDEIVAEAASCVGTSYPPYWFATFHRRETIGLAHWTRGADGRMHNEYGEPRCGDRRGRRLMRCCVHATEVVVKMIAGLGTGGRLLRRSVGIP